ncbi:hypothetical protein A2303_02175 [Candidatus Falkowbacteria bacterium RIFOXYB2_FULL_47_14]|uniref:Uncharacterized protein n=1 Tax=Candidatus Falkowbacteria bacterium RIFOXYA2_FULL_47_19 TaxID=1797994 RepID=A0A1F5SEL9_9BACT|nr:MAG: hypothetical protein A2227_07355 [Candidatus Falkowbacteria bacterium RIFOXYA2_FULL_47_19]OGF35234.1 MAG: hypothetical protein A2468_00980 [Candidatus Falkowbacteria bacterium RIFOXYC2_FULL_46_15]OGF43874.1 MAG: hypothetical protein A2303_02175 [Candidatus Falkowbacteria bacterium RIFOXYB2_FULL_47_14]
MREKKNMCLIIYFEDGLPILDISGLSLGELQDVLNIFQCPVIAESMGADEKDERSKILFVGSGAGAREWPMIFLDDDTRRNSGALSAGPEIPVEIIRELQIAIQNYPGDEFDAHLRVPAKEAETRPKKIRDKFKAGMESLIRTRRAYQRRRV